MRLSSLFIILLLPICSICLAEKLEELDGLPVHKQMISKTYLKAPALDKLEALDKWRAQATDADVKMFYTREISQILSGRDGIDTTRPATRKEIEQIIKIVQHSGILGKGYGWDFEELYGDYRNAPLEHTKTLHLLHENCNKTISLKKELKSLQLVFKKRGPLYIDKPVDWDDLKFLLDEDSSYFVDIRYANKRPITKGIVSGKELKALKRYGIYPFMVIEYKGSYKPLVKKLLKRI